MISPAVSAYGEPKGAFISKSFSVTNMKTISESNKTNVLGIIKNIGGKTVNGAYVAVELYNSNNSLLNVIYAPLTVYTLGPNETSPFKVWTNLRSFDHYIIRMVGTVGIN
jgi:hypothetical protein